MKLRTAFAVVAAVGILAGCADKTEKPHVADDLIAPGAPAWKLTLKSTGAAGEEQNAAAYHGFTVIADGRYQVGPAAGGQTLKGVLSPKEFATVQSAIEKITGAIRPEIEIAESCEPIAAADESTDTIYVDVRGAQKNLVRKSSEFCFRASTSADAQALLKALKDLAAKHYPANFPNECSDSIQGLQNIFAQIGNCKQDSDCAYVNNVFGPIANGALEYVITDNCSAAPALVVANSADLIANEERLIAAKANARTTCGASFFRSACTTSGFQASDSAPICHYGSCRVSPSIYR